ncbi:MAG TPA: hypothetical protein VLB44_07500 [Kofleriaceae bacterium]|nr:hypothetical protein [Kofleriaceae bacterium]
MVRVGVTFVVLFVAARIANSQPSQPPPPSPSEPTPPPSEASPPPPVPSPPPEAAGPSRYDQCMEQRRQISAQADATSNLKERTRLLQSRPECRPDMDDAPPGAPVAAASATEEPNDGSGVAVEVHLETGQIFIDSNSVLPTTQAGLFVGIRGRSVTFGVALDFARIAESTTSSMGNTSDSANMIFFMPGLRGVLARSHDDRTELLGEVDIGYGRNWTSSDSSMGTSNPSTGHLRVQAAPGLRYWVSQWFAIGAVAGLRYERFSRSSDAGGTSTTNTVSMTALFSSVQLTGVF